MLTHITGHKIVGFSVEINYRHLGVFNRINGGILIQIKVAVKLCAQFYKGVSKVWWQLHSLYNNFYNILSRGITAVSKNTDNDFW